MRTLSFALFFSTSLFAACTAQDGGTQPGNDELAGENGTDGEAAKADGVDTFGMYTAQKVGAFECNGAGSCTHVTLARANRTSTTCADGTTAASCDVRTLDFTKLGLSASQLDDVMSKLQASAATPEIGPQLIVRGKYVHGTNPLYMGVDWVTFQVSEVWAAQLGEGNLEGTFVMMTDNGRRCFDAPCASVRETRLNSTRFVDMDGVDWSEEQDSVFSGKVNGAIVSGEGAIVVGDRTHGALMHLPTTLRSPNEVFLRVK
jgi:hypothetical protein